MHYSPEKINDGNSSEEVNLDTFENNIKKASPTTLKLIWETIKRKETWWGIFTLALGSFAASQVFGNEPSVRENILETMRNKTPDPEDVRQMLFALKGFASGVMAIGIAEVVAGIINAKQILDDDGRQ